VASAQDLLAAVQQLRPSILIGVSTVANAFNQEVIEAMADINARPLIFPLSNPTSKAECSFEQAVSRGAVARGLVSVIASHVRLSHCLPALVARKQLECACQ
jgi:malic enzyme